MTKPCAECGREGRVGIENNPYYESNAGIVWLCRSCSDARYARKERANRVKSEGFSSQE
jgi:hypothetical protein